MSQTRLGSFVEAWANILLGGGIAFAANILWSEWLGIPLNHSQNFKIVVLMTAVSLGRSYMLRRVFNKTEVILSWLRKRVPRLIERR